MTFVLVLESRLPKYKKSENSVHRILTLGTSRRLKAVALANIHEVEGKYASKMWKDDNAVIEAYLGKKMNDEEMRKALAV